jgi:hypothetical protein
MKKYIVFIALFFLPYLSFAGNLPSFKVVGQDKTAISIIVPPNTTTAQLKSLTYEFRKARMSNMLSKMIPPTTKGGAMGDYAIVWIFMFSEQEWASESNLKRFIKSSLKNPLDQVFDRGYAPHIKAEYYYSIGEEYGNIGYDDGIVRNKAYKKLF